MSGLIGGITLFLLVILGISVIVGATSVPGNIVDRIFGTAMRIVGSVLRWILNFVVLCASSFVRISINRFILWRRATRMRQRQPHP